MTDTKSDQQNERREVALRCADNGIPVVPQFGRKKGKRACAREDCPTPGAHPRINEGTTDSAIIHQQWDKWLTARAAIATGASNIIAVKLALTGVGRPDEAWSRRPPAWAELEKAHGLARTVVFHSDDEDVLLFTVPAEDVPHGDLKVEDGITVYGAGEYVELPKNCSSTGKLVFGRHAPRATWRSRRRQTG